MNDNDREQLRLLSVLHYIAAGLASFLILFGTVYAGLGAAILRGKLAAGSGSHFGWGIFAFGTTVASVGTLSSTLNLVSARCLRRTRHHTLCVLTACLNLLHVPLGTALGAFTLALLSRPSIRQTFSQSPTRDVRKELKETRFPAPGDRAGGAHSG